jgi:hypothetical protein
MVAQGPERAVLEREWDLSRGTRRHQHHRILGKAHQQSKAAPVSNGGCNNVLLVSTGMESMGLPKQLKC